MRWVDFVGKEEYRGGPSCCNPLEAEVVCRVVRDIKQKQGGASWKVRGSWGGVSTTGTVYRWHANPWAGRRCAACYRAPSSREGPAGRWVCVKPWGTGTCRGVRRGGVACTGQGRLSTLRAIVLQVRAVER